MKDYMEPKIVECVVCEQMFDASLINRGKGIHKYCSKKCRTKADNKRAYARRRKPTPILDRVCVVCELPFVTDKCHPNALTCSVKCNEARMNIEKQKVTMSKVVKLIKNCLVCDKEFEPHRRSLGVQKYCSPECGATGRLRADRDRQRSQKRINPRGVRLGKKVWKDARERILNRDRSCMLCDSDDNLHVHHIASLTEKERNDHSDENLICLCGSCHSKIHKFELGKQNGKWVMSNDIFKLLNITEVTII